MTTRILLVKMSSMGDTIHTLPALSDALHAIPDLEIDWVVEPAFQVIPSWHPAVKNIILIPLRAWRKNIFSKNTFCEVKKFLHQLREKKYDLIIDAQGLLKSAVVAKCAHGKIHGYDPYSAREKWSSYFYDHAYKIESHTQLHAITRIRQLFSHALKYTLANTQPDFGINQTKLSAIHFQLPEKYYVFLHGTTWKTKHYPDSYWKKLIEKTDHHQTPVFLLWSNPTEKNRVDALSKNSTYAKVLPKLSIAEIATLLKNATVVISVDTGLGHLSSALTTPTIGLYGPTNSNSVGMIGDHAIHLQAQFSCAPCLSKVCMYAKKHTTSIVPTCYTTLDPEKVWEQVMSLDTQQQG